MLLIAIVAAVGIGSAPVAPMHVSSPPIMSAPAVSRPVTVPQVVRPVPKPPPPASTRPERKRDVARAERERPLPPSMCYVSRNEPGVGALYGIAVAPAPASPGLACPDISLPRLLPF